MTIQWLNEVVGLKSYTVTVGFYEDKDFLTNTTREPRLTQVDYETAALNPTEAIRFAIKELLRIGVKLRHIKCGIAAKENIREGEG